MFPPSVMGLVGYAFSDHKNYLKDKAQESVLEKILLSQFDDSSLTEIKFEFQDGSISYSIHISNNDSDRTSKESENKRNQKKKVNQSKCPRSVSWILKGLEKEKHDNEGDYDSNDDEENQVEEDEKSVFDVDKNYVCKYCLTYFSRPEKCREHIRTFHENLDDIQYECNICDRKYKTEEGLSTHMTNKHISNTGSYKCITCNKIYINKTHLIRHCKSENHEYPEGNSTKKPYLNAKCPICKKYVGRMNYHMKIHHSDNEYQCDDCDFKTKRKDNLLRHERLVHSLYNKKFDCIDKTFKYKVKYKCPDCKNIFQNKSAVVNHLSLKNCQELKCKFCGKCFKLKQHLVRHEKIHQK